MNAINMIKKGLEHQAVVFDDKERECRAKAAQKAIFDISIFFGESGVEIWSTPHVETPLLMIKTDYFIERHPDWIIHS